MDNPEISGLLHKKRGGFGKMMPNAWQFRFFTISKEGVLVYYDTESPDSVIEGKGRGKIDLKGVNYELITDQFIEGAPTPFCIQVCPPNEEKWKLCSATIEDHGRWCRVLEKYLVEKSHKTAPHGTILSYASDDEGDHHRRNGPSTESTPRGNTGSVNLEAASVGSAAVPAAVVATPVPPPNNYKPSVTIATAATAAVPTTSTAAAATGKTASAATSAPPKKKGGIKIAGKTAAIVSQEWMEWVCVLAVLNFTLLVLGYSRLTNVTGAFYLLATNFVVGQTMSLRHDRVAHALSVAKAEAAEATAAAVAEATAKVKASVSTAATPAAARVAAALGVAAGVAQEKTVAVNAAGSMAIAAVAAAPEAASGVVEALAVTPKSSKPIPGATLQHVTTDPKQSPDHTWCHADSRQFHVRIGPDYNRYKKKAPSEAPLYEPFAVDVFCTKKRIDHASQRFQMPDTSGINTGHQFVPPIFVIQIQIPSEPPASFFSTSEDGPGWAIVMYYRITEDTCRQLQNLSTASPAVKLFAEWCEKAPVDAAWRGRFKVINSCTNLEELGMPSAIVAYNAKPVLIRRTGTIFRGENYMEMNIHVHKFANLAKQSIYLISSRCNLMYMQIGFVIEGREDKELPEVLFACVAVNKPQEDQAEFIFEEEE